jgi:molybdopterin-guanine dinucleotide biosynthesis protein B
MIPIISIVGKSKSGKTTLIEKLVPELKSRGYKIATVKHTTHFSAIDTPGKDSWRHIKAGSGATAISSSQGIVLFKPTKQEAPLEQVIQLLAKEHDIIIAEGFKEENTPKIQVHRKKVGTPLSGLENVIAIASDATLRTNIRQFQLDDIVKLSDIIEKEIIKPQRVKILTYINNKSIQLSNLQKEVMINTLIAMTSSMKEEEKIESIDIAIRRILNRGQ